MKPNRKITTLFVFALVAGISALTFTGVISKAMEAICNTVVVTNDDVARQSEGTPPTKNWVLYTRPASPGVGTFEVGPANPPLGVGSLELKTTTGNDKVFLFNYDHVGTELADINKISYSTYRETGNNQQVAALNIQVDFNGPNVAGGFTTLVFEPVYNTDQGPVVSGVWQDWDAYNGGAAKWWSTRDIPGVCAFDCFVKWEDIVAANPDATILGGFGVNQGSGNSNLTTNVDALSIGTEANCVTYDFEPFRVATAKDQCKNGGWQTVKRADGTSFKNQGDCIQYVNNGR
jgi:hypothetical protein